MPRFFGDPSAKIGPQDDKWTLLAALCLFIFALAVPAFSQNSNTSSLSCWEGKKNETFQSRQAKSPLVKGSGGFAYAVVTAEASTDSGQGQFCKNKAELFYSKDGTNYRVVYEKPGLDDQGVGLHVIGWSQNGTQLLMELLVWGYDNDAFVTKSALVLDSSTAQVQELPVDEAFQHLFGRDCEYDFSVVGWESDTDVLLRVTRTQPTTHYQQTFCVEKPTLYAFNQQTKAVAPSKGSGHSSE
jgi:hypothetical protein